MIYGEKAIAGYGIVYDSKTKKPNSSKKRREKRRMKSGFSTLLSRKHFSCISLN